MDLYPPLSERKHAFSVARILSSVSVNWSGLRRCLITRHPEHENFWMFQLKSGNTWFKTLQNLNQMIMLRKLFIDAIKMTKIIQYSNKPRCIFFSANIFKDTKKKEGGNW